MDFFQKITTLVSDLSWNIPEIKQGRLAVIGGNSQNFKTSIKTSEFLAATYPIEHVDTVLPDALKSQLPPLDNFIFLPSTDSGSFADAASLTTAIDVADFALLLGDFSKNSITRQAVTSAVQKSTKPLLLTRDTIDLITTAGADRLLMNGQLILFASMPQLQALFRAIYYPKMLLLTQSLVQVAEILHKFTLSYPIKLITLHQGQILLAENGTVRAIPLAHSGYAPFAIWSGELAAKISALNLFSPGQFLDATTSAIFAKTK